MDWWTRLFSGGYEALWQQERAAANAADLELERHMDPEAYRCLEYKYALPDGRWGIKRKHRCGPARLKRELAARGSTGAEGVFGHVLGGHVDMYVLAGPVSTGRQAASQRGGGHEGEHIDAQLAAAWEGWEKGLRGPELQAYADAHTYDADHQGEGI